MALFVGLWPFVMYYKNKNSQHIFYFKILKWKENIHDRENVEAAAVKRNFDEDNM